VSAIYDEFELELGKLRDRFAGVPRKELIRLFLLALEREEIVSVAYRGFSHRQNLSLRGSGSSRSAA
jgi:hypothetical protein